MKGPLFRHTDTLRLVSDVTAHPKASPSGPAPPGGDEPSRLRYGRLAQYIHSDRHTPLKGIAVARITTETDFAARTEDTGQFARDVAKFGYAAQSTDWRDIVDAYPAMEQARVDLESRLRESVEIDQIVIVKA